jgi:hypothetical protein
MRVHDFAKYLGSLYFEWNGSSLPTQCFKLGNSYVIYIIS